MYKCLKENLGIPKNAIIVPDKEGKFFYETNGAKIELKKEYLESDLFEKQENPITIKEINEQEETVNRYRIEIDVKCKKSKLKEIEKFLNKNINKILHE
jgi:predicted mannosyl-3-phosphoglycerate phosphatase (HAD superfamily)